jgi:hypothetical protein
MSTGGYIPEGFKPTSPAFESFNIPTGSTGFALIGHLLYNGTLRLSFEGAERNFVPIRPGVYSTSNSFGMYSVLETVHGPIPNIQVSQATTDLTGTPNYNVVGFTGRKADYLEYFGFDYLNNILYASNVTTDPRLTTGRPNNCAPFLPVNYAFSKIQDNGLRLLPD